MVNMQHTLQKLIDPVNTDYLFKSINLFIYFIVANGVLRRSVLENSTCCCFSYFERCFILRMLHAGRSRVLAPTRWLNCFSLPNPSSRIGPWGVQPLTEKSTRNRKKSFSWVEHSRHVRIRTSPPSVSRLPVHCGILNISQPNRPPCPVMRIAFFLSSLDAEDDCFSFSVVLFIVYACQIISVHLLLLTASR
jgi:hypothetical protein